MQADAEPSSRFGAWVVARVDQTGRRATVVCKCGVARQVSVEVLISGASLGCGCLKTPRGNYPQKSRTGGFASAPASAEGRSGRKRQFGSGWEK